MAHHIHFNEQTHRHSFFSVNYVKLYITITGYFQNVRTYKDEESKMKSILYGGTAQCRTQKAFTLCEEFVKGGLAGMNN